jgi:sister chromatid cohesion protein DCC1
MLFRVREKWTVDEIAPYVECLTTPILNVNGLLTKFARAANVNGQKVFCSKHGK